MSDKTSEILKQKSIDGKRIDILIARKTILHNQLKSIKANKFYIATDTIIDFNNQHNHLESIHIKLRPKELVFDRNLQHLGKDIVKRLNDLETVLIKQTIDNTTANIQLKIDLINHLLEKLGT